MKSRLNESGLEPIFREKFVVNVWAWWENKRSQVDADGILKLILDCMQGIVYSSDKFALPRWMDYDYDAENPRVQLEVVSPPPIIAEFS